MPRKRGTRWSREVPTEADATRCGSFRSGVLSTDSSAQARSHSSLLCKLARTSVNWRKQPFCIRAPVSLVPEGTPPSRRSASMWKPIPRRFPWRRPELVPTASGGHHTLFNKMPARGKQLRLSHGVEKLATKNRVRVENEGVSVDWPHCTPMPVFHDVGRGPQALSDRLFSR